MTEREYLDNLIARYPVLEREKEHIDAMFVILRDCFAAGGKLLVCGNGGSAADAEHIVGELMKGFVKRRPIPDEEAALLRRVDPEKGEALAMALQQGLTAIALDSHPGLNTAFANDVNGDMMYAQQVQGFGRPGDVLLGISTSGNSANVLYAAVTAKAKGMKVIGLLGRDGGRLLPLCEAAMVAPEQETYKIQELHLPVYHALCLMLEEHFFEK